MIEPEPTEGVTPEERSYVDLLAPFIERRERALLDRLIDDLRDAGNVSAAVFVTDWAALNGYFGH